VAQDSSCRRLEGNPEEIEVFLQLLEVIVQDGPLSKAVEVLNERGHRKRDGGRLSKSEEWAKRRKQILQPRS